MTKNMLLGNFNMSALYETQVGR
ncbi:MAG: hypothetical protein LZF86_210104 [Nitrospira sp.]|nr:MAG: hypothetical protein LZF86_210104 [Nitrospira sp.]